MSSPQLRRGGNIYSRSVPLIPYAGENGGVCRPPAEDPQPTLSLPETAILRNRPQYQLNSPDAIYRAEVERYQVWARNSRALQSAGNLSMFLAGGDEGAGRDRVEGLKANASSLDGTAVHVHMKQKTKGPYGLLRFGSINGKGLQYHKHY
eukprot:TRINITY_DN35106_c0_g1_i1.p1 TRINITY_DN35106_c0_g1~~TRINITY_DN35106_c0_g1_i1.p1  ORF type:complete len:150 (+),score=24.09 TRINITY_DN35106_c0_g1_i1:96-545(+)